MSQSGRFGSFRPERARIDRIGDRLDRFILANDPLVQDLIQAQEFLLFALHRRESGIPVHRETTSATSSAVTSSCKSLAVFAAGCFLFELF